MGKFSLIQYILLYIVQYTCNFKFVGGVIDVYCSLQ